MVAFGISLSSLTSMSVHRFLHIVKQKTITKTAVYITVFGYWISVIVVLLLFHFFGLTEEAVALQSSRLYCFQATWSTVPPIIASTSIIILLLIIASIAITYCNFAFVMLMRRAKLKKDKKEKEMRLTKRAVVVAISFLAGWITYILKLLIEFCSKRPVSDTFDAIAAALVMATPVINGILLIKYDSKIKRNLKEMFGLGKTQVPFRVHSPLPSSQKPLNNYNENDSRWGRGSHPAKVQALKPNDKKCVAVTSDLLADTIPMDSLHQHMPADYM